MRGKILLMGGLLMVSLAGCVRLDIDDVDVLEQDATTEGSVEETTTYEISTYEVAVPKECAYKEIRKIYDANDALERTLEIEYDSLGNELKETNSIK